MQKLSLPLISVILPVHNNESTIRDAIDSILSQTFTEFELIVINDGSTDKTPEILKEMANIDRRIWIINNEKSLGITKSLNAGISKSRSLLIARMDGDDLCVPTRLEEQYKIFQNHKNVDLVFTDSIFIDLNGNLICKSWRPSKIETILNCLQKNNFIPHPSVMFKKETILLAGGYNEQFITGQDTNLWLKLRDLDAQFFYLPMPLILYRLNPNSMRKNIYQNYWCCVASYCIWNKNKIKALKYLKNLKLKDRFKILFKMLIPHCYYYRYLEK